MQITSTLYLTNRKQWRSWLKKHYKSEKEIWLIYYKKHSNKPRLPYNDAVEEALCFGWIDSIVKRIDEDRITQRFTPRRKGSPMSEMNKERVRMMIKQHKMTKEGLRHFPKDKPFKMPKDIEKALKQDKEVWKNFNAFPKRYQRVRVAYVDHMRPNSPLFKASLNNLIKKTKRNKKYGMIR